MYASCTFKKPNGITGVIKGHPIAERPAKYGCNRFMHTNMTPIRGVGAGVGQSIGEHTYKVLDKE